MVREPRSVLREDFGQDVADSVEIRVWDSSAEIRYFVLPLRPLDTADLTQDQLAGLVTREAMVGTGSCRRIPAP
jgi:nitrile hydratase